MMSNQRTVKEIAEFVKAHVELEAFFMALKDWETSKNKKVDSNFIGSALLEAGVKLPEMGWPMSALCVFTANGEADPDKAFSLFDKTDWVAVYQLVINA